MKVAPAFFRNESVYPLLERAAKAAAVPMSLHFHAHDGNELHLLGWGNCKICTRANKSSNGFRGCCESRMQAAITARQQHAPVTFVCPLGLTCVSVNALEGYDYVITFGPYVPAEAAEGIEHDVVKGLRKIEGEYGFDGELPVELTDVRAIPAGAVSALAEWVRDALHQELLSQEHAMTVADETACDDTDVLAPEIERRTSVLLVGTEKWVSLAALALVCGHYPLVREFLENRVEELSALKKTSPESVRAFLIQATAQLLETARKMGGVTESAQQHYGSFVSEIEGASAPKKMLGVAMRLLRKVRADVGRPVPPYLPTLVSEVHKNYRKSYELSQFAEVHHLAASTVTRALACRINATFTEYLGRVRIEQAQRLLRNTKLSAGKIGVRVGITDQSNFGKLFLRYTGVNPGAYREKFQRK